ncbi:MAG: hypothetical protein R3B81_19500 [bacterium]
MKKIFGLLLAAALVGGLPASSLAGGCGCVPVSLPTGDQFLAHNPGALRIGWSLMYSDTNHYFVGTERQDGPGQTEETVAPSTLGLDNTLSLEYDLEHNLSLAVEIPIVHTEQAREFGGVSGTMEASGLGDVRALARYWFRNEPVGLSFWGSVGVRLPTGKSDRTFRAQNDMIVTQDLAAQDGTGNAAGILELGGSQFFGGRYGLSFQTRYIFTPSATTVPNFRYELTGNGEPMNSDSDALTARVSLATPLGTNGGAMEDLSVRALFDLAWIPWDDLFGDTVGFRRAGMILAAGPGLSYTPIQRLTFSAAVPLTLYRNVQRNGGNVQEWTFQFGVAFDSVGI